ncbi:hypothetical protein ABMA28_005526 [Loxostege sticticalis]|uniref:Fucosyltransferase n=1 Tax=Loxostege sticticalis TaxID=481309 RepID=A0ABD0SM58_LOXSC
MLRPPTARCLLVVSVCVFRFINAVHTQVVSNHTEPTELNHANTFYENVSNINSNTSDRPRVNIKSDIHKVTLEVVELKFILLWNVPRDSPFDVMMEGQAAFYKRNCQYKNCFITDNRTFLADVTMFDAVVFNGKRCPELTAIDLPKRRLETQKYILGATESAHYYPMCDPVYDDFFNWTWTYRLDSDILWRYITIYDLEGHIVGPRPDMKWPELAPVNYDTLRRKLASKYKMVAWFVSNCNSKSKRERFVGTLDYVASQKYGWNVDVYGWCGPLRCPREQSSECYEILKLYYYFYLAFENSFAQDYVTEKLLNALNNDVVPVVFGRANYSSFLPPGSYLDARKLGPVRLADTMDAIYNNKTRYFEFFRWKNHFRYNYSLPADVCNLCAAMNDKEAIRRRTMYKYFRRWWNEEPCDGCGFESRSIPVYVFLVQFFFSKLFAL